MNLKWDDLKLFLAVHEQGSLSAAARQLKLGQPTLSRRIAELEADIGEALFERQSQGTHLTATGQKLLPAPQRMAEWASEAELSVRKQARQLHGKVRIAAPPGIAYSIVAPLSAAIRRAHPGVQLEVLSGVELLNLSRGEADLALRTAKPNDADLICVDEITSAMRVYVSPDYAATLPAQPQLNELDWICWAPPYDQLDINRELAALIPGFKPAFTSDDYNVQFAACQTGVGAMILPQLLYHYNKHGTWQQLQELDIDLGPAAQGTLYLVSHKRHRHLPKVRLAIDYISAEFARLRQHEPRKANE